jgi:hypothetical protein
VNARFVCQGRNLETGIVRESRKAAGISGSLGFDEGIFGKGRAGLFRFGKSKLGGGDDRYGQSGQQIGNLADLSGIVAGNHKPAAEQDGFHGRPQIRGSANSTLLPAGSRT